MYWGGASAVDWGLRLKDFARGVRTCVDVDERNPSTSLDP